MPQLRNMSYRVANLSVPCWYQSHIPCYQPQCHNCAQLSTIFNPLNPELNPICYLLALLGAHHFLHVSRIRVNIIVNMILHQRWKQMTIARWQIRAVCGMYPRYYRCEIIRHVNISSDRTLNIRSLCSHFHICDGQPNWRRVGYGVPG